MSKMSGSQNTLFYKLIQESYFSERTAARVYLYEARMVKNDDLAILLRFIANTEILHANELKTILTSAGIKLERNNKNTVDIVDLASKLIDDKDILRFNRMLESQTYLSYRKAAGISPNEETENKIIQIAEDEKYHEKRFYDLLIHIENNEDKEDDPLYVLDKSIDEGKRRLSRSVLELLFSGIIGGISVTLGAIASSAASGGISNHQMSLIVASAILPIGFFILKLTNTDLFTANFLIPVTPILEKQGKVSRLIRVWAVTYIGNFIGVLMILLLIIIGGKESMGPYAANHFIALSEFKMNRPVLETFISAIFAGMLITLMTWLVLSVKDRVAKLIAIWIIIFTISIGMFTHVILSSAEVFIGAAVGAPFNMLTWIVHLGLPGTIGNMVGGILVIAVLYYLHLLHSRKNLSDYRKLRNTVLDEAARKQMKL